MQECAPANLEVPLNLKSDLVLDVGTMKKYPLQGSTTAQAYTRRTSKYFG